MPRNIVAQQLIPHPWHSAHAAIQNRMKSDTPGLLEPRLQGQTLVTLRLGVTVVQNTAPFVPPLPVRERQVIILPAAVRAQL